MNEIIQCLCNKIQVDFVESYNSKINLKLKLENGTRIETPKFELFNRFKLTSISISYSKLSCATPGQSEFVRNTPQITLILVYLN